MSAETNIQKLEIPVSTKEPRAKRQNFELSAAVARSDSDAPVKGVVLMGIGSEGLAPKRAARLAAIRGVQDVLLVQAFRYSLAYPDRDGLIDLAVQSALGVTKYARQELGATKLHGVGESQAGPALIETAIQEPEAINGALVLLHAIGMIALSNGDLIGRMARSAVQRDQQHAAAPYIAGIASGRATQDFLRTGERRGAQMQFVLRDYDMVERIGDLMVAQPERRLYAATGSEDFVVPPAEQYAAMASAGLGDHTRVIPGASHSTLASPAGADQLAYAAQLWTDPAALPQQRKAA